MPRGSKYGRGRPDRPPEIKVTGRRACAALFERRPHSVIRAYLTEDAIRDFQSLLRHCVDNRLAYHVVDAEELERVSASRHHEGVCILAREVLPSLRDVLDHAEPNARYVLLDAIDNPHNLGAVLRTAAHFGVRAVLVEEQVRLTPAAHRIAEGGAAWVDVVAGPDLVGAIEQLKARGVTVFSTSDRASDSLYDRAFAGPTAVVLGNERDGVSRRVAQACDGNLCIPGTGQVNSLNVSVAAGVVLSEMWRRASVSSGG